MTHALRPLARFVPLFVLCLALAACGGEKTSISDTKPAEGGHDDHDEHGHDHAAPHGGSMVVSSDHALHFEIAHDAGAGLVKLWIYDADVKPLATSEVPVINIALEDSPVQVKGQALDGKSSATEWHFSHEALKGHVHGARLRILAQNRTYMVDFPDVHDEDGHDEHEGHDHDGEKQEDHDGHAHDAEGEEHDGHDHDADEHAGEGPHHGILQAFTGADGKTAGYVEIKLHADVGDIELWIAHDEAMKKPLDLPLGARPSVTFTSMENRKVSLQVRNEDENEDEDGVANNRDGKTNYFVFPGETGRDVAWLQGKAFKATVAVAFQSGTDVYKTKAFELKPHTH